MSLTRRLARLAMVLGALPFVFACSGGGAAADGGAREGGIVGLGPPCSQGAAAHVAFNIENMQHANDAVLIDQMRFNLTDTPGIYFKDSDVTSMAIYDRGADGGLGAHVEVYFKGDVPDSQALGTMTEGALAFDHVLVHIFLPGEDFICCNETTPDTYMGHLAVTDFPPPGGLIKGSFDGKFDGASREHGGVSATITNGSFAVTRCPDGF